MSVLAVIPARLAASRLPRKPLRLLGGAPLVVRVWERVAELHAADRCVIATDSPDVLHAATAAGAECVLTHAQHQSGTDRVAELLGDPEFTEYSVFLNVQGDEPFISAGAIRGALELVAEGRFPIGTAAAPASDAALASPHVVKVVRGDHGRALYFSRAPIPYLRDPADRNVRSGLAAQHIGIYAYTRDALRHWVALPVHPLEQIERLEQLRPLAAGIPIGVALVDEVVPGGIDTEDDLIRANERWSDLLAGRAE